MIARRYYLGRVSGLAVAADRATVGTYVDGRYGTSQLTDSGFEATKDDAKPPPVNRGTFEVSDLGSFDRLGWEGGATSCAHEATIGYLDGRYAAWMDEAELHVVDAVLGKELVIGPLADEPSKVLIGVDRQIYISDPHLLIVPLDPILALFETATPTISIEIHPYYPSRRERRDDSYVVEYLFSDAWLKPDDGGYHILRIPLVSGLDVGVHVRMRDELWSETFRTLTIAGKPPVVINEIETANTIELRVAVRPTIDPIRGGIHPGSAPVRGRELDDLLKQLADEPDAATRTILVDLWNDAGEVFAPAFALMLAGNETDDVREDALSLFVKFMAEIDFEAGLPNAAILATEPPRDHTLVEAICADQRLGLFRKLLIGEGPIDVYTRLVTSLRAVGLREVSGGNPRILRGLIEAGRTQITAIHDVKFGSKDTITALADPTFDRVRDVTVEVDHKFFAKQCEWITRDEAGFWKRGRRHLHVVEKSGDEENLVPVIQAAWPKLPLAAITAGSLTLTR
ncbi:MAG: hypothetical protein QM831_25655 [Kofleriaceae bacterium]